MKSGWRAWHTFQAALLLSLVSLAAFLLVSVALHMNQGELRAEQTNVLLALLYRGTFPLAFIAIGALAWHAVRTERGDLA